VKIALHAVEDMAAAADLLLQREHLRRQQAVQAEAVALFQGEGGTLVAQRVVEQGMRRGVIYAGAG
jgi:hypothetical protein